MKNLKISVKMMTAFGIVVILTLAMGIISIRSASGIEKSYTEMVAEDTKALSDLGAARAAIRGERSELRAIMIYAALDDSAGISKSVENYQKNKSVLKTSMDSYSTGLRTEEGLGYYSVFEKEYEDYTKAAEIFLAALDSAELERLYALMKDCSDEVDSSIEAIDGMEAAKFQNVQVSNDNMTKRSTAGIMITVGILIAVTVVSIGLAVFISAMITKPLGLMRDLLQQVGESGDLEFGDTQMRRIREEAAFKDEIGQSIAAFVKMMEQFVYYGKCLGMVAEKDLTVNVKTLSGKDTCGVALKNMLANLNSMFGEINISASQVASGSSQIAQASTNLATGAGEQAATIQEFTATVSEVNRMAEDNTKMATEVLKDVQESGSLMNECTNEMNRMLQAMQLIDEKSQQISNVIKVIDDIAFQTNILALNAAVEAARAGQHGKGFAVVSDEVRNLASKSAGAAKETAELIESSLRSVAEGNMIVCKVNDSLQAVGSISDRNAESVEKLYNGSTSQSSSMSEINTAILQLSSVVQANSATAQETAASSQEMSAQSVMLNDIVSRFKLSEDARAQGWTNPGSGGHAKANAAPASDKPESVISLSDSNDKY
ncbi:MAG: methyl-accepting chemotaxis protein [Clostridiales Family XIII bacterium]|jgi:methyl-accepting chemotaxis protein|nr:methyl-accepting chemotaxis protein [Clostridiales Family XIII bacterium]